MSKNLALQNHPARVGEIIKWQGRYWRCIKKHGIYSGFEPAPDRADWVKTSG